MLIEVNTDNNITGSQELTEHVSEILNDRLGRFEDQITRLELFLGDVNGKREAGDDKRATLEARLKGTSPVVVTAIEGTIHQAVRSAADTMQLTLEKAMEKKRVQS